MPPPSARSPRNRSVEPRRSPKGSTVNIKTNSARNSSANMVQIRHSASSTGNLPPTSGRGISSLHITPITPTGPGQHQRGSSFYSNERNSTGVVTMSRDPSFQRMYESESAYSNSAYRTPELLSQEEFWEDDDEDSDSNTGSSSEDAFANEDGVSDSDGFLSKFRKKHSGASRGSNSASSSKRGKFEVTSNEYSEFSWLPKFGSLNCILGILGTIFVLFIIVALILPDKPQVGRRRRGGGLSVDFCDSDGDIDGSDDGDIEEARSDSASPSGSRSSRGSIQGTPTYGTDFGSEEGSEEDDDFFQF